MNLQTACTGARSWPWQDPTERNLHVALMVRDREIYREVLEILSGRYDLVVLRQSRDLLTGRPGLVLTDSEALLTLVQAGEGLRERTHGPVLAVVNETDFQRVGLLLSEGVEDFLVRPFAADELLCRVQRALRRFVGSPGHDQFTIGDLRVDFRTGEVYQGQRTLSLTRKETALLHALVQRMGSTVTRDELLNEVWGVEYDGASNVLDVHIRSLRRKVEPTPAAPRYILTVRGVGYRFVATG